MKRNQREAFLRGLGARLPTYSQLQETPTEPIHPERLRDQWDHAVCRVLDELHYQPGPNDDPVAWRGPFLDVGADAFPWIGDRLEQTTDAMETPHET